MTKRVIALFIVVLTCNLFTYSQNTNVFGKYEKIMEGLSKNYILEISDKKNDLQFKNSLECFGVNKQIFIEDSIIYHACVYDFFNSTDSILQFLVTFRFDTLDCTNKWICTQNPCTSLFDIEDLCFSNSKASAVLIYNFLKFNKKFNKKYFINYNKKMFTKKNVLRIYEFIIENKKLTLHELKKQFMAF